MTGFRMVGFRILAVTALTAGGAGSVAMMLRVGHRNDAVIPVILAVFFTFWVASPFAALAIAELASTRWAAPTRTALRSMTLIVPLGSLVIYGYVTASPPRPKPAAVFLLVPLASWGLLAIVTATAAWVARRGTRRSAGI